ncbi:MAG: hypothetical protein MK183_04490 [Verrucomicrobiales bacterium]|nr:hypothetical protein [Verrucomicrobiales bacterium]MED5586145.1 hypothetical protein [Verrucomicrobiota bacterium]
MNSPIAPTPKDGNPTKPIKKRFQELAKCSACGTTLSNTMNRCPSCGKWKIAWWKWLIGASIWLLIGLLALYFIYKF